MSHSCTHHIQCLMFVVHEGPIPDLRKRGPRLDPSKIKGYAVLPSTQLLDHLHEIFRMSGIRLLSKKEDCPPELTAAVKSDRVEMLEIIIDESGVDVSNNSLRICVQPLNLLLTIPLFSGLVFASSEHDLSKFDACSALNAANLEIIEHLLAYSADIRYRHTNDGTLLHFAVERSHEQLVRSLLDRGARLEALMRDGATPLHVAVYSGNVPIFSLLLEQGANVNAATTGSGYENVTPLHLALYRNHLNMVKPLLDKGAQVDADSALGNVLSLAVRADVESLACVLSHRPDLKSASNQAAFRSAFQDFNSEKEKVQLLLDYGFKLVPDDAKNPELLFGAVSMGFQDIVQKLLGWGASIHQLYPWNSIKTKVTPLHVAASMGDEDTVRWLLNQGANVNAKDSKKKTPLRHAVEWNNVEIVKFLLANGAIVPQNSLLLHVAARVAERSTEIVEVLLRYGLDINAVNGKGETALIVASTRGQAEVVQVLCRYGARIDADDRATLIQFYKSVATGNLDMVKVFIQNGFDIESEIENALICAIKADYLCLVEFFLELEDAPGLISFFNFDILKAAGKSRYPEIAAAVLEYAYLKIDLIAGSRILTKFKGFFAYGDELYIDSSDSSDSEDSVDAEIFQQIYEFAGNHVVKLKAANLRENQSESIFYLPKWPWKSSFPDVCEAEVALLKAEKIGDSNVTFYEILDATVPEMVNYAKNKSIVNILKGFEYEDKFPIYGRIIFRRFCKGYFRRKLLDNGIRMFDFLFKGSELPLELKEKIVDFLRNESLLVLNNVCKLPDDGSSTASDA